MLHLILILIPPLLLIFWALMFWHMATNTSIPPKDRPFWILGFIFLSILTAAYYFLTEYNKNR